MTIAQTKTDEQVSEMRSDKATRIGKIQDASDWIPLFSGPRGGRPRAELASAVFALSPDKGFEISNVSENQARVTACQAGIATGGDFHVAKIGEGKYRVWRSA